VVGAVVALYAAPFQVVALLACMFLCAVRAPPPRRRQLVRAAPFGLGLSVARTAFAGLGLSLVATALSWAAAFHVLALVALVVGVLIVVVALNRKSLRRITGGQSAGRDSQ